MIEVGMLVKYRPEWCKPEERKLLHLVKEDRRNEYTENWLIVTLNSKNVFGHCEEVSEEMIEPTGFTIEDFEKGEIK